jgi:hypothetical protein
MKKNVIVFGGISGLIVATIMAISMAIYSGNGHNFDYGMLVGYASMLLAFSFVFIGIKNYRDKYNNGLVTFGQAFKTGLFISLIASTMYVITWLVEYYFFIPDFMDQYAQHMLDKAKESGVSAEEMTKTAAEMNHYKELYKSPVMVILFTYMEILPVGLLVTLISALILKRKNKPEAEVAG